MQIGIDRIINAADTVVAFVMQIGVTRCGRGGRVQPRCRNGRMASVANLIASTVELIETEIRPTAKKAIAAAGRAVVALALLVVAMPIAAVATLVAAAATIARSAVRALRGLPRVAFAAAVWGAPWILLALKFYFRFI